MTKPVKAVFQISRSVSNAKRASLGQVCVDFAILEWAVDRSIWALKGLDRKVGRIDTQSHLTKSRINAFSKAALSKFGAGSRGNKEYAEIAQRLTSVAKARNKAVHGLWAKHGQKGLRNKSWVLTYFKNPDGVASLVTKSMLDALAKDIRGLETDLHEASLKHLGGRFHSAVDVRDVIVIDA